jgi:ubiquinone/menaquinone biosynthesis C-methylase UbiE
MSQQDGGPGFRNTDFSDIDRVARPEVLVQQQNLVNSLGGVQAYKRRMAELLAPQPGDQLLDAGCGSGADALALAALVGPAGRVVGVDRGAVMVTQARERAEGSGLHVVFQVGDITALDFPDSTFDGCRTDRVMHHLDDPAGALAELVRVARPGGRIVVFEPDLETILFDYPDHTVGRRLVDFWADTGARNARLGRRLYALFRAQGLADIAVEPQAVALTDLAAVRGGVLPDAVLDDAQHAGVITAAEATAWLTTMKAADRAGRFLMIGVGFLVSGRKP